LGPLKIRGILFALTAWLCIATNASAQLIEDILLNEGADGKVHAVIALSSRIQYLRHFPENKGDHLEIYFTYLDSTAVDAYQGYEARTSPPSDLIPGFVVALRDPLTEPKIVLDFNRPVEYSVRVGADHRSLEIILPSAKARAPVSRSAPLAEEVRAQNETPQPAIAPAAPASAVPAAPLPTAPAASEALPPVQTAEFEAQAEPLMSKGREAMKLSQYGVAIDSFNKVLQLPPNKFTQDAQELVGVARESIGQTFKAKLEYEAYLKAYATGDGVARVKERLARLNAVEQPQAKSTDHMAGAKGDQPFITTKNGSLSMNYYYGQSLTTLTGAVTPSTPVTDQSMLITNVSASLRSRNDRYDNRIVFQDIYNKDYLNTEVSQLGPNRLAAAYYEYKDNLTAFAVRLGRQSPISGGAVGRFDGVSTSYGLNSRLQFTGSAGQLSDYQTGSKPTFYSVGLALSNFAHWGGSVYYIKQQTNGISDRNSLGGDIRYFNDKLNVYSIVDYDTFFKVLNTATLQGTYNGGNDTSYTFGLDHRKTPPISLSNALIGSPSSMSDLLANGYTLDQLKALALLRTANSNTLSLGVTRQINEKWQTGADFNVSNTSGLPQSGTPTGPGGTPSLEGFMAASPSSGNNYAVDARVVGNGAIFARDVTVATVGYTSSQATKGETFMLTNHAGFAEKWMADSSFRLYWQNTYDLTTGAATGKQTIIGPAIRLSYQLKNNVNLETDGGLDITNFNPSSGQSSKTTRKYFSFGGRWDF
jgi:hypothetical protein